ncbi:MAG TPA: PTS sugar transporter subunit IIB [Candidatus Krumholzibacteria bacterium]|nr:PTS sugar transporter subunit IIB [Candidatus Krumholzibacteria bacterium]
MAVALARIDDRLIHGQVTVGWGQHLRPDLILLASNAIAADPWQAKVYASSVPPEIGVAVLSVHAAAARLLEAEAAGERVLLLTASAGEMAEIVRLGAPVARVNVGGMHFSAGKHEMLPFVYVDRQDVRAFRRLLDMGIVLAAQQVPGGRSHPLGQDQITDMEERV